MKAATQTVFLVKGLRKIREVKADIHVCEKMTWARIGPKSYLLGTSAFFTRKAAEVRKLGELRKLSVLVYPAWMSAGRIGQAAREQLQSYEKTGALN